MAAAFGAPGVERPLLVVGGPRFDPSMAASIGVDKIFGKGTGPAEVASYLAHALAPAPAKDTPAKDTAAPRAPARAGATQ
jgi:beta-lysine 5,6-aminomutase beta subunit